MVSWDVPIDMSNARAVAGRAGMMMCIPKVPHAVMATSKRKGARARLLGGEVKGSRMFCPVVAAHYAQCYLGFNRGEQETRHNRDRCPSLYGVTGDA